MCTGESCHSISGKDSSGFMSGVHDADAHFLAGHQDGRDVPTNKSENILDSVRAEDLGHALATMPWTLRFSLRQVKGQNEC